MTLVFLCAYACPVIALRQTVHARIDTATRKRRLSETATEETKDSTDCKAPVISTAQTNAEGEDRKPKKQKT